MRDTGRVVSLETITADLAERDHRDRTRKDAPLVAASDAITLDTSDLDRDQAVARAIAIVEELVRS
jgi:cytidylate kinase